MSEALDLAADVALQAKIVLEEAKEQYAESIARLTEEAKKVGQYDPSLRAAGHARIKIVPNRYFDLAEAEKLVTKKVVAESTVKVVDPKILKTKMTPEQVEKAMKNYSNPYKISLSVLEDD